MPGRVERHHDRGSPSRGRERLQAGEGGHPGADSETLTQTEPGQETLRPQPPGGPSPVPAGLLQLCPGGRNLPPLRAGGGREGQSEAPLPPLLHRGHRHGGQHPAPLPQHPPAGPPETQAVLTPGLSANLLLLRPDLHLALAPGHHQEGAREVPALDPDPGQLHSLHQETDSGATHGEDSEREGDAHQARGHQTQPREVLGVIGAGLEAVQHQLEPPTG